MPDTLQPSLPTIKVQTVCENNHSEIIQHATPGETTVQVIDEP